MRSVCYLHLRQMLGDRRIVALVLFVSLPAAVSLLLRVAGRVVPSAPDPVVQTSHVQELPLAQGNGVQPAPAQLAVPVEVFAGYLFLLYPQVMCELLALLYASTMIQTEMEGQTLSYLFTRPIAKWQVLLAKYAATVAALVGPVAVSLLASWLILAMPGGPRLLGGVAAGSVIALVAYSAVFLLLGALLPARAMVLGLMYALVEFALSFVPAVLNTLTITYHLRTLVAWLVGLQVPEDMSRVLGGGSPGHAARSLALIVLVALSAACFVVSGREYIAKTEG